MEAQSDSVMVRLGLWGRIAQSEFFRFIDVDGKPKLQK